MLKASGEVGELWAGYQKVADLTKWNLQARYFVAGQLDITLSGKAVHVHPVYSLTPATAVWLWMGQAWWVWNRVMIAEPMVEGSFIDIQAQGHPVISETRRA